MNAARRALPRMAAAAGLVALIAAVYGQVGNHGFVSFDDPGYIRRNLAIRDGLTLDGVRWAFGTFRMANWHPLTWISHMLDIELWGMDAGGHHIDSVVLHALNALLLLAALARMTGAYWTSLLVAALFAVHPLRVESVAWASERKDVLAGTCFMLTLLAHARYAERPNIARAVPVWLAAALGLMAKPMLVTLPFVLLLLDAWPLGRWSRWPHAAPRRSNLARTAPRSAARLLAEKLPLLLLSAGSIAVTVAAQGSRDAISPLESLPLGERLANTPLAYVRYLRKAVLPTDLAFWYPHVGSTAVGGPGANAGAALGALLLLALLTLAAWRASRASQGQRGWLAVGWFWFLGMLVPVIGLVQVGSAALADRYAYLPLIGLSLPVAWGLADFARRGPARRTAASAAGVALVLACLPVTWRQVGTWRNNATLYGHALDVTTDNYIAHASLGLALLGQDRRDEAEVHLLRAIEIAPSFDKARVGLGSLYLEQQRFDEAAAQLERALSIRPDTFEAVHLLGRVRAGQDDLDAAAGLLEHAVALDPASPEAQNDLGLVYARQGRLQDALDAFRRALQRRPDFPEARTNVTRTLRQLRD